MFDEQPLQYSLFQIISIIGWDWKDGVHAWCTQDVILAQFFELSVSSNHSILCIKSSNQKQWFETINNEWYLDDVYYFIFV